MAEDADFASAKDYDTIAFDLRVDAALVKSVVEDFGLFAFTKDGGSFYSESLDIRTGMEDDGMEDDAQAKRDEISAKRSEAGRNGMRRRWEKRGLQKSDNTPILRQNDSKPITNDSKPITNDSKPITNDSKKEKEREKENVPLPLLPPTPPINPIIPKEKDKEKENVVVVESINAGARARERDPEAYGGFLNSFFDDHPMQVESLCMQMQTDAETLRTVAAQVVDEWELTETSHMDYSDMARHLISQMRIKLNARQDKRQTSNGTNHDGAGRFETCAERNARIVAERNRRIDEYERTLREGVAASMRRRDGGGMPAPLAYMGDAGEVLPP